MYASAYTHYVVQNNVSKLYKNMIHINWQVLQAIKKQTDHSAQTGRSGAIPQFNNTVTVSKTLKRPPQKSLRGGSLSMPKALRRRQANSPVRSFPHKSTEVRDGRGQELPSNSDPEPNCQDVFGHTKTLWWRSDSQPKSVLQRNRKPTDNSFPWQQKISQNCSRFVWVLAIHKEIMKVFSFLIYLIWPQLALSISATSWLESPEIEGLHCVSIHFRDENSSGFKSSCVQNRDEILTWSGGLCKANASSNTKSWHITW